MRIITSSTDIIAALHVGQRLRCRGTDGGQLEDPRRWRLLETIGSRPRLKYKGRRHCRAGSAAEVAPVTLVRRPAEWTVWSAARVFPAPRHVFLAAGG